VQLFSTNILRPLCPLFIGNTTASSFREHSNNPVMVATDPNQEAMMAFIKYFSNLEKTNRMIGHQALTEGEKGIATGTK
jgi:hypothetical protein